MLPGGYYTLALYYSLCFYTWRAHWANLNDSLRKLQTIENLYMNTQNQTLLKPAIDGWLKQLERADKLFENYTDEELSKEIAPGKNSGVYLLGHLTSVHDLMLPLLRLGEQLHPELVDTFIKNPDRSGLPQPGGARRSHSR